MRNFIYIRYLRVFPRLRDAIVENIEGSVETNVKNIRIVEDTKVGKISREICVGETSWYLRLLRVSNKVSFVFLSMVLLVSMIELW